MRTEYIYQEDFPWFKETEKERDRGPCQERERGMESYDDTEYNSKDYYYYQFRGFLPYLTDVK